MKAASLTHPQLAPVHRAGATAFTLPLRSRHGQLLDEETHAPPIDRSHLLEGVKKYTYLFYDGAARMLSRYNYEDETTPKSYCLPSHASA